MTANQRRAIGLAERLRDRATEPDLLGDADWHLLLLAAGYSGHRVDPRVVADAALVNAERGVGFFAGPSRSAGDAAGCRSWRAAGGGGVAPPPRGVCHAAG